MSCTWKIDPKTIITSFPPRKKVLARVLPSKPSLRLGSGGNPVEACLDPSARPGLRLDGQSFVAPIGPGARVEEALVEQKVSIN